MHGDETTTAYLDRAQEYATALANIGKPMDEKDILMLVVSGLREEYNGVKQILFSRDYTAVFTELPALLADHEYMIKKPISDVPPVHAFTAHTTPSSSIPDETLQSLQQLVTKLGFQLQPQSSSSSASTANSNGGSSSSPSAYYTSRGRGRGGNGFNRGGPGGRFTQSRGTSYNRGGSSQFSWASNQNTVYGSCNRCGIGHLPTHCPNRDPSTIRSRQPISNFTDFRSQNSQSWITDTGSNSHVSPDMQGFDSAQSYFGEDNLHVGNGKGLPILHIGYKKIFSPSKTYHLKNILHVPDIKQNLLSVQKFCFDNNVYFEFHSTFFCVKDTFTHHTLLTGPSNDGLYSIRFPFSQPVPKVAFSANKASTTTWHQRLGHPHFSLFRSMISKFDLPVLDKSFNIHCESCLIGKSSKLHLPPSDYKTSNIFDLLFCDVWGPAPVPSFDGHNYFLLIVDHFTKFMWIFPIKQKSDVLDTFKRFIIMVERQFSTKIKAVQSDWGGEFRQLSSFFKQIGINHRISCPHTSEQNGTVERRHRHVVETGLTLMAQSRVPSRFWHFAYDTAVYLINRMPSRTTANLSPFEHLFKIQPDFSFLRVFGCQCFPHLRAYNPNKMDFRSVSCVFLGYSPSHHGYRCFDPIHERLYIARHVRFIESAFPFHTPPSEPTTQPTPTSNPYVSSYPDGPTFPTEQPTPPQTSAAASSSPPSSPHTTASPVADLPDPPLPETSSSAPVGQPPSPPLQTYSRRTSSTIPAFNKFTSTDQSQPTSTQPSSTSQTDSNQPPPNSNRARPSHLRQNVKPPQKYNPSAYHATTAPETEPVTFTNANGNPQWRKAMAEEFSALLKNGTWTLVPRDPNYHVINCKWVYRIKRDQTGAVSRYKARLVAKGYNQQEGVDYNETFSPVVKPATIRTVLSLAVTQKWSLRQLDVQNAFLNGNLQETVYMQQPQGFVDPHYPDHVCLLRRSLYGLKQAPRAWFERLCSALGSLGFYGSKTDPSLFIYSHHGTLLYMLVYVDDIILTGNNDRAIDQVVKRLGATFSLQDMGPLSYFLGVEVVRQGSDIILSQRKYIQDILARANLLSAKPVHSPCTTTSSLSLGDSPAFSDPVRYRQLVGALQYVTLSRPDISFAVNKVCQFMHSPTENHWSAVKRILRFLLGTINHGLLISHSSPIHLHAYADSHNSYIQAYSDADWAGCPDDRRSTGGFAIYLGNNLVSWSARKQKTVSRSSTESEYKAMADTVSELVWLETLLRELHVIMKAAPTLWCDNLGATYLSRNPVFHARTKHIEVDYHTVRERVARGQLMVVMMNNINGHAIKASTLESKSALNRTLKSHNAILGKPNSSTTEYVNGEEISEPTENVISEQRSAKIHDFCFGLPYGGIVLSGGLIGFIFSRNTASLVTGGLYGGALLALSVLSLKIWKQGQSSTPFILGQLGIAAALLWKNIQTYSLTKKILPTGFHIVLR
ncbi:putative RNA-directed DNA polymerase [Helianthus annuus]|nr:putative RNA-directed DNA polymerase [Helianthus annuus]